MKVKKTDRILKKTYYIEEETTKGGSVHYKVYYWAFDLLIPYQSFLFWGARFKTIDAAKLAIDEDFSVKLFKKKDEPAFSKKIEKVVKEG